MNTSVMIHFKTSTLIRTLADSSSPSHNSFLAMCNLTYGNLACLLTGTYASIALRKAYYR